MTALLANRTSYHPACRIHFPDGHHAMFTPESEEQVKMVQGSLTQGQSLGS